MKRVLVIVLGVLIISFLILYFQATKLSGFDILSYKIFDYEDQVLTHVTWSSTKNVKDYIVSILSSDGQVLYKTKISKNELSFDYDYIKEEKSFTIEVLASARVGSKHRLERKTYEVLEPVKKVYPVTGNRDSGQVSGRKELMLKTKTSKASIYYIIGQNEPVLYEEPIKIDRNMTITAYALKDGSEKSEETTFSYRVLDTKPIIYLSPSTQEGNIGVKPYTNEKEMMNKVADVVEKELKDKGYVVHRNKKVTSFSLAIKDSKKYDPDLHLAIHSNSSVEGTYTGIETWIHNEDDPIVLEIATRIQKDLFAIYYQKKGNRGVKYSSYERGLAEVNPDNVNHGILVEVAFHDQKQDASWIVNNITAIGKSIAQSVISYYEEE